MVKRAEGLKRPVSASKRQPKAVEAAEIRSGSPGSTVPLLAVEEERSRLISLRLPPAMLDELRAHAKRRAMPYQSLLKHWLAERLVEESERLARHHAEVARGQRG